MKCPWRPLLPRLGLLTSPLSPPPLHHGSFARGAQDVGMIDSEAPKKRADRKAALRRQHRILREDIENLQARAVQQVSADERTAGVAGLRPPQDAKRVNARTRYRKARRKASVGFGL